MNNMEVESIVRIDDAAEARRSLATKLSKD
jgi:hypothetical protein